jgi:hypothetical protein
MESLISVERKDNSRLIKNIFKGLAFTAGITSGFVVGFNEGYYCSTTNQPTNDRNEIAATFIAGGAGTVYGMINGFCDYSSHPASVRIKQGFYDSILVGAGCFSSVFAATLIGHVSGSIIGKLQS